MSDMKTYSTIHAVAQNNEGKYLILQRAAHRTSPGKWNFVTGYVQEREAAEDAALRELKEEANLDGEVIKASEPWWGDSGDKRFIIVSVLIKVEKEETLKIDGEESQSFAWVTPTDDVVQQSSVMKESLAHLHIL